jgi:flagellar hook assembly protein FlgD
VTNTTAIGFFVPKRGDVRLEIFDVNGELVTTLVNNPVATGYHSVVWDGTNDKGVKVASGSYTYRLTSGPTVLSRTMILTR